MTRRDGMLVAAHFGSPATEAAVCRSAVGMTDRSGRATLEVLGAPEVVDQALEGLSGSGAAAWWTGLAPHRALVRCEATTTRSVRRALAASGLGAVLDRTGESAAVGLVGPRAQALLRDVDVAPPGVPLVVLREAPERFELLVPAAHGPLLWHRLLDAGAPFDVACVGLEALEHLDAGARAGRPPQAAPPTS
jgi:sarcosine oxidase gamma subunit